MPNTIKATENRGVYIGAFLFPLESSTFDVQTTGKTNTPTFMFGGSPFIKEDFSNHFKTIKFKTSVSSQERLDYLTKLVRDVIQTPLKFGDETYSNAILKEMPSIKLQETFELTFFATAKP
jgi:hypothetical protein